MTKNLARQTTDAVEELHAGLTLNYSTSLAVRVGLSSLGAAVGQTLLGRVLFFLSQPTSGASAFAETALRRAGAFESQAARNFGITEMSGEWLLDESGHHLLEALEREFNRQGLHAAQRSLESWQAENQEQAAVQAEEKVREILAELDGVKTLRDHAVCLDEVAEGLQRTQSAIESAARAAGERHRRLTEYLQNNTAAQAPAAPAAAPAPASSPRLFTKTYRHVISYFGYARGEADAPVPVGRGNLSRIERETLNAGLELAVLAAETAVVSEIVELLRQERATDEELLTLLAGAEGDARRDARRMEGSRNYGLAAGELLLNGESLTGATIRHLFGDDEEVVAEVFGRFVELRRAESVVGEIANMQTDEINSLVEDLLNACRQLVSAKMEGFTIADALAALLLCEGQADWHAKLDAAFKATAATNFLTPSYAKYLDPQIFAAVTYAPSRLPQNNERLRESLESIRQSTHLDFDIKADALSREQMLFYCEFFCVPLEAFRFYEEGWKDFEPVKGQPRYNPHPDIHAEG